MVAWHLAGGNPGERSTALYEMGKTALTSGQIDFTG